MFPIIAISGTPHERGRQYGAQARGLVQLSIASYARLYAYSGLGWDEAHARAQR